MNETKKPWCYYCRTDSHRDALCWSTRPKHWIPGPEDYEARIAALEKRLAEAERILRDTLDAIPGEAIGKKQIVAFLENTHD